MLGILNKAIGKIFGSKSDRDLKELNPFVDKVKERFTGLSSLTNDELRARATSFKQRIQEHILETSTEIKSMEEQAAANPEMDVHQLEEIYKNIDTLKKQLNQEIEEVLLELLPEAFAVVKETARRLTENTSLTVTATELDRLFATSKDYVSISGDKIGRAHV
mgnify:CR=1 FL=1